MTRIELTLELERIWRETHCQQPSHINWHVIVDDEAGKLIEDPASYYLVNKWHVQFMRGRFCAMKDFHRAQLRRIRRHQTKPYHDDSSGTRR